MVITKGKDGATLYRSGDFLDNSGHTVNIADTVGSVDAFLSGMLADMLKESGPAETLE